MAPWYAGSRARSGRKAPDAAGGSPCVPSIAARIAHADNTLHVQQWQDWNSTACPVSCATKCQPDAQRCHRRQSRRDGGTCGEWARLAELLHFGRVRASVSGHVQQHTRACPAGRLLQLAAGEDAVDVRLGLVRRRRAVDDAVAGRALVRCRREEVGSIAMSDLYPGGAFTAKAGRHNCLRCYCCTGGRRRAGVTSRRHLHSGGNMLAWAPAGAAGVGRPLLELSMDAPPLVGALPALEAPATALHAVSTSMAAHWACYGSRNAMRQSPHARSG